MGCLSAREVSGYDCTRLALGLLLLTAAALKGHQLAAAPVPETGLLTSRWFLIGVVEFELFFGLWLLSGLYPKWTWRAALACFSGFACVTLYKALSGESTCGCFGRVPVNPWYTFVLDCAAVAALFAFRRSPLSLRERAGVRVFGSSSSGRGWVRVRIAALGAMLLAIGLPGAWAMATYHPASFSDSGKPTGAARVVVLEPERWMGRRLPLLKFIDIGDEIARGEWTVLLYHHDCPNCQRVLAKYQERAAGPASGADAPRVALVEIPPYARTHVALPCTHGRVADDREWYVSTPLQITLAQGIVREITGESGAESLGL
jgi:hypothetical protein